MTSRRTYIYHECGNKNQEYYTFTSTVGPQHPNPERPHSGLQFYAFLPNNKDGKEVCDLLKMAFDARMLFTIGTSPATKEENVLVCNGIELKTSESGGPAK